MGFAGFFEKAHGDSSGFFPGFSFGGEKQFSLHQINHPKELLTTKYLGKIFRAAELIGVLLVKDPMANLEWDELLSVWTFPGMVSTEKSKVFFVTIQCGIRCHSVDKSPSPQHSHGIPAGTSDGWAASLILFPVE